MADKEESGGKTAEDQIASEEAAGEKVAGGAVPGGFGAWIALLLTLIPAASLYFAILTPASFGDYNDDAIYLATAKSLANGQGYRIISLPSQPHQTKYPPVYPMLLSLIWRIHPAFPANLVAMMAASVLASLLACALAWFYLTSRGYATQRLAAIATGLAAINAYTAMFSTGVFSEMPYMALSMGALWLAEGLETGALSKKREAAGGVLLGILIGLACLTRMAGITLAAAAAVYFVLGKHSRRALLPLTVALGMVLAWFIWTSYQRPHANGTNDLYFTSYSAYAYRLIQARRATGGRSFAGALWLIVRNNAISLVKKAPLMSLGFCPECLGFLGDPGRKLLLASALGAVLIAAGASRFVRRSAMTGQQSAVGKQRRPPLLLIYFALYTGFHLLLPYPDSTFERYLVPVLPFLVLFLMSGAIEAGKLFRWLWRSGATMGKASLPRQSPPGRRRGGPKTRPYGIGAVLVATMALALLAVNALSIYGAITRLKPGWKNEQAQNAPLIEWIKANTRSTDRLASVHHALYYLYTGRTATLSFPADGVMEPDGSQEHSDQASNSSNSGTNPSEAAYDHTDSAADKGSDDDQPGFEHIDEPAGTDAIQRILMESRIDYLVVTGDDVSRGPGGVDFGGAPAELVRRGLLQRVYASPDGDSSIYKVEARGPK